MAKKTANIKCPKCKVTTKIDIPKDKCLSFYICKACKEIITVPENICCVICAYSDKKCQDSKI